MPDGINLNPNGVISQTFQISIPSDLYQFYQSILFSRSCMDLFGFATTTRMSSAYIKSLHTVSGSFWHYEASLKFLSMVRKGVQGGAQILTQFTDIKTMLNLLSYGQLLFNI